METSGDGNPRHHHRRNGRESDRCEKSHSARAFTPVVESTRTHHRTPVRAIRISLGFALLWAVLAAVRPGTTFHLAPLLVAGAVPWMQRVWAGAPPPNVFRPAAVGLGLAAGTSIVLAMVGWLDGPSLLPFGGALEESLVGALVGSLLGLAAAATPSRAGVG